MSRDSFDDFLRVKKFPDLLTKILCGLFWQFYVDFCILSFSACNVDLQDISIYNISNVDGQCGRGGCIYLHRQQYTITRCIISTQLQGVSAVYKCRVYPSPPPAVLTCRMYLSIHVSIVSRVSLSLF